MFENLNTALTPRLQSSRSVPHLCRPADALGSAEPGGPGLWVGSSQHLKNLGRAVGAKVNDFLRRREPWGPGTVGAMAINRTAEAQLAGGTGGEGDRLAREAVPRLDPPPPVTRKRTPRALKTTQDMLISSQPVLSCLECGTEPSPAQPGPADASQPETTVGMADGGEAVPNGELSLSVPDLIHQESQDEPRLQTTASGRASPSPIATNSRKVSLAEPPEDSGPRPQARTSSLDNEGPHPDLLSFE